MLKAIVHIGTEKTGTTSIQNFLYQNRKKLRKAGFHFLQCAGEKNNRALPAYCLNDNRPDDFYRDLGIVTIDERIHYKQKFIEEFEKELAGLPKHIKAVVISSEHFHSRIRTFEEMDNVQAFFDRYFDDVEIVCYLRDQISTCTSYYSTALKSGNPSTFSEFIERCTPKNYYFNYFDVLANWERCFGIDALNVSLFSRKHFLNGDLLDDFTAKLSPTLVGQLDTNIKVENESFTPVGQALARAVNVAFPIRSTRPELEPLRDKCRQYINENHKGKGRQLTPDSQEEIYAKFLEVNEAVRIKFFPEEAVILQPAPVEDAGVELIDESYLGGFNSIMDILRKEGPAVLDAQELSQIYRTMFNGVNELQYRPEDEAEAPRVLTRDNLRFLRNVALQVEKRDKPAARNLLELVKSFDPTLPGVLEKLAQYKGAEEETKPMSDQDKAKPAMQKYFLRYTVDAELLAKATSGEEGLALKKRYSDWGSSLNERAVGSSLNAMQNTRTLTGQGRVDESGPVIESAFTIINATSIDEAEAIAAKCPHLEIGGTVEVSLVVQLHPRGVTTPA